eukprot:scaffold6162_cov116-Isochrysis_galbana.AAC.5
MHATSGTGPAGGVWARRSTKCTSTCASPASESIIDSCREPSAMISSMTCDAYLSDSRANGSPRLRRGDTTPVRCASDAAFNTRASATLPNTWRAQCSSCPFNCSTTVPTTSARICASRTTSAAASGSSPATTLFVSSSMR